MRKWLLGSLLCLFFIQVMAVPVSHLYTITIPVSSQQVSQRDLALRTALAQVLVRISGDSSIVQQADIQSALSDANSAVQEYRFQTIKQQNQNQLFLRVRFQPQAVNNLITKSGHGLWGQDRPLLLIWLAVKSGQQVNLISADSTSNLPKFMHDIAGSRGLPTLLPVLDLNELSEISPQDVWDMKVDKIQAVSNRYAANAELILRLTQSDAKTWAAQGQLLFNQQNINVSQTGDSAKQVLDAILNRVTDTLAKQYNQSLPQQTLQTFSIEVINVRSVAAYAAVTRYLRQLDNVKDVQVASVSPNKVQFAITIANGINAFNRALSLDRDLVALPSNHQSQSGQEVLRYQWNR